MYVQYCTWVLRTDVEVCSTRYILYCRSMGLVTCDSLLMWLFQFLFTFYKKEDDGDGRRLHHFLESDINNRVVINFCIIVVMTNMNAKVKSTSIVATILLAALHRIIVADATDNQELASSAPLPPIDLLTRRMPSTPLSIIDDLGVNQSEFVVDSFGRAAQETDSTFDDSDVDGGWLSEVEDFNDNCEEWAADGECNINPGEHNYSDHTNLIC